MSGTKRKIYWDTAIYCAWLKQEEVNKAFLPHIEALAKESGEGKAIVMTSVLTLAEILECKYSDIQYRRFLKAFNPYSHIKLDIDARIAAKAAAFRMHYDAQNPSQKLRTPDAIHLATAVIYGADEIWTFDKQLLGFDGQTGVDQLQVKTPHSPSATRPTTPDMFEGK